MRILTGLQPTNTLHIGNLFGALLPAISLQEEHELFLMIADYHAITIAHDPKALKNQTQLLAATMLALGVDTEKTFLFRQSDVSAHTELGWILQTQTSFGEASRMTQFKDKSQGKGDAISVGLFTYPTLMAADILLYNPEAVPVGADQKQHLELARNLAERMNKKFETSFVIPEPLIQKTGAKIMSLTEPEKKMSKSAASAKSYISLMDEPEVIRKKIRSAVTDSLPGITYEDARPGLKNLLTIIAILKKEPVESVVKSYQEANMKMIKDDLAELLIDYLAPLQEKIRSYMENPERLQEILEKQADKTRIVASQQLNEVKKQIGIL